MDELEPVARLSGMPELPRRSIFHALNQKAVARRYAKEHGVKYEDLNLIVIHLGGGVSVGAHSQGKVVDVNNILDGEGAFSPREQVPFRLAIWLKCAIPVNIRRRKFIKDLRKRRLKCISAHQRFP